MTTANININDISNHTFKYLIGYSESETKSYNDFAYAKNDENDIYFFNTHNESGKYVRNHNQWKPNYYPVDKKNIPSTVNTSEIYLYIPKFSVDSLENGVQYSLTVNTWIQDKMIVLGTYIIDNLDCMALDRPVKVNGTIYYEGYKFNIINPKDLLYSSDWLEFRKSIKLQDLNDFSSIINFTLYPVVNNNGIYEKLDKYYGGQNSINMSINASDYLNLKLSNNLNYNLKNEEPSMLFELEYNGSTISDYLKETYGFQSGDIASEFTLVFGNQSGFEKIVKKCNDLNQSSLKISKTELSNYMNHWEEGMFMVGSFDVYKSDYIEGDLPLISVLSNKIPFTVDMYKFFRSSDYLKELNSIELNKTNMKIYKIDAVNKIVNKIVSVENVGDSKSNIIQPVFFKTYPTSDIIIHPNVTENICINLDMYKARVNMFLLKIGESVYREIGRIPAGVLFKIKSNTLNSQPSGIYYILDDSNEMVVSGKYNCLT